MVYNEEILNEWIPVLLPIVIALLAISLVLALTGRMRRRFADKHPRHLKEVYGIANVLRSILILIIALTLLESLEVPLGNVWTAVSTMLALVAIGFFAVWSILSHMTAALVLFLQRPFREGEILQLGDESYSGKVIQKGLFFTTVLDDEGGRSQIPNNLLFQRRFRITSDAGKG